MRYTNKNRCWHCSAGPSIKKLFSSTACRRAWACAVQGASHACKAARPLAGAARWAESWAAANNSCAAPCPPANGGPLPKQKA